MQLGIIGLPNVGKSTLFNALTLAGAEAQNFPFCTVKPNIGVAEVPDERLEVLKGIFKPLRTVPAVIKFVDIAGLVKGAHRGEGLGNQFLDYIRNVDAVVHVLRCFTEPDVSLAGGAANAAEALDIVETEMIMADLEIVERNLEQNKRQLKTRDKNVAEKQKVLQSLKDSLERGKKAADILSPEEKKILSEVPLLTVKPEVLVANISEVFLPNGEKSPDVKELSFLAQKRGVSLVVLCAKIEQEFAELKEADRKEFMEGYGLKERGLERLIRESYRVLKLVTFFTTDGSEIRAWTVQEGTPASKAAGKIHSDMERGFIRAEVVSFPELAECGGINAARERGLIRLEGKEYRVQEGDVIHFRFAV